jgi:cystathionine beta-lyase
MPRENQENAPFDFNCVIDRRSTDSLKWGTHPPEVIPMWVADMDFPVPDAVMRVLRERVDHGIFGYAKHPLELIEVICERLLQLYGWNVAFEAITFTPGVVPGFNLAIRALARPDGEVLIQTPVYPPFLKVASHFGLNTKINELQRSAEGSYGIDFDAFQNAIGSTTRTFLFCNPHNPVGRVFRPDELSRMAEICLRNQVIIVSDEIHCDLVFQGHRHIPIASLDPEIAQHTITLMAPSKTFNIAGLECSFAIIPDANLRRKYEAARAGMVPGSNLLAYVAALAAYREGHSWLEALLRYLEANRDLIVEYVTNRLPSLSMPRPEGTFLAWLDCREPGFPGNPASFFLKHARVALNDGKRFGQGGEGFVRLNFGCPKSVLLEGLDRMAAALGNVNR